mgnify:FL=1
MQYDEEEFLYPEVDTAACVNYGIYEKVYSQLSERAEKRTEKVYYIACQNKNEQVRRISTSGWIFGLLAEQVISSGGVVWGAGFDDLSIVVHKEARALRVYGWDPSNWNDKMNAVLPDRGNRTDCKEEVIKAEYDIRTTVKQLEIFYTESTRRKRKSSNGKKINTTET